jgi:hypothetical protein
MWIVGVVMPSRTGVLRSFLLSVRSVVRYSVYSGLLDVVEGNFDVQFDVFCACWSRDFVFDEFISADRVRHQTLYLSYYLKSHVTESIGS